MSSRCASEFEWAIIAVFLGPIFVSLSQGERCRWFDLDWTGPWVEDFGLTSFSDVRATLTIMSAICIGVCQWRVSRRYKMISWYTYGHLYIELCHIFVQALVVIQAEFESSKLTCNRMELHKNGRILQ
jgi:hypothetical protein